MNFDNKLPVITESLFHINISKFLVDDITHVDWAENLKF